MERVAEVASAYAPGTVLSGVCIGEGKGLDILVYRRNEWCS
jgi:hypothetical protein